MDIAWMIFELDQEFLGAMAAFLALAALALVLWLEYRRTRYRPLNRGALRRLLDREDEADR